MLSNMSITSRAASSLVSKLVEARDKSLLHKGEFQVFSNNLKAAVREDWERMILNWETDCSSPDPFYIKSECM